NVTFPDGTTGVVKYSNLIGMTLGAMYDSSSWEDFAGALADLESQASAATLGVRLQQFWHPWNAYITKRGMPRYYNGLEGIPAVACANSDNPRARTRAGRRTALRPTRSSDTSAGSGRGRRRSARRGRRPTPTATRARGIT